MKKTKKMKRVDSSQGEGNPVMWSKPTEQKSVSPRERKRRGKKTRSQKVGFDVGK